MSTTTTLATTVVDGKEYYNAKHLQAFRKELFVGCQTKPRHITDKKNIPSTEYIYANAFAKTNTWNICGPECRKAQLLLAKAWVDMYLLRTAVLVVAAPVKYQTDHDGGSGGSDGVEEEEEGNDEEENVDDRGDILPAPPLVYLEDHEKFTDVDGNVSEIETRGEKSRSGIFFKVTDVARAFNMPRLNAILLALQTSYVKGVHYCTYISRCNINASATFKNRKTIYLTYKGLLRVLFASRSGNAEKFQDWAEERLFAHHMGSREEKVQVGADLLGVSARSFRAVFDSHASKFPAIYLMSLGKVGVLRETFGIATEVDGDATVYKYGFTDNLERRMGEQQSKYGKLANVNLTLSIFHIVDVKYTSEAEGDVRDFFKVFGNHLKVDGYNELVAFPAAQHMQIKKQYKFIGEQYLGNTAAFQSEIAELKQTIQDMERTHLRDITAYKHADEMTKMQHSRQMDDLRHGKELVDQELSMTRTIFQLRLENLQPK